MYSVRGAATIDLDTREEIDKATRELLEKIIIENKIEIESIISIFFSSTKDIRSAYPAKSARDMGIVEAGLFCLQEMDVEGSLTKCIRVLMHVNENKKQSAAKHVYLGNAVNLRPDLKKEF